MIRLIKRIKPKIVFFKDDENKSELNEFKCFKFEEKTIHNPKTITIKARKK